jgi:hypothetical protein
VEPLKSAPSVESVPPPAAAFRTFQPGRGASGNWNDAEVRLWRSQDLVGWLEYTGEADVSDGRRGWKSTAAPADLLHDALWPLVERNEGRRLTRTYFQPLTIASRLANR